MSWLAGFLLSALVGLVANGLVRFFDGTCPFDAAGAICQNWQTIATVGASVLAALGYGGARVRAVSRAMTIQKAPAPEGKRVTDVFPDAPAAGDAPAAPGSNQPGAGEPGSTTSEDELKRIWSGP